MSTNLRTPSHKDWETVRLLITKTWYQEEESLSNVISILQRDHGLKITEKMLKNRLRIWGLIKKMSPQEAEDILTAQARLDDTGTKGILISRGRVRTVEEVDRYQRRRDKTSRSHTSTERINHSSQSSQVIALSLHPQLRPHSVGQILFKFESVLREMQYLLQAAKDQSMCNPGQTKLHWAASSTESVRLENTLQYSTWEGARAFEEGKLEWAGLCWKTALLALERLVWEPDLNVWITFIRCCIRLVRFQAGEVAQKYLDRLRWLKDELPCTAPHRTFVWALAEVDLDDLAKGGLFLLEANLRTVESLWPLETNCRIQDQIILSEEQYYQGLEPENNMLRHLSSGDPFQPPLCSDVSLTRSLISSSMLLLNYGKAETIVRKSISELEQQMADGADENVVSKVDLAGWYFLLGTVQFYAHMDAQSRVSYYTSLHFHKQVKDTYGESALEPVRLHRMMTLLIFLNATLEAAPEVTHTDPAAYKQKLEMTLRQEVQDRENELFRRQSAAQTQMSFSISSGRAKTAKHHVVTRLAFRNRDRVVPRPVPLGIDVGKCRNIMSVQSHATSETLNVQHEETGVAKRSSKSKKAIAKGNDNKARQSPQRPRPPPCPGS